MAGYFSYFQKNDYLFSNGVRKRITNLSKYSAIIAKIADNISYYTYYTMQDGERLDMISQKLYRTPDYYWTIPLMNYDLVNTYRDMPKDYLTLISYLKKKYSGYAFKLASGESLAGKFEIGETLIFNGINKAKLIAKYPTNGYLHVEVLEGNFPMNQVFTIIGEKTNDSISIANVIEAYNAPAYHVDSNDNQVPWNAGQVTPITIREVETDRNLAISQIKVIHPSRIYDIALQFEREMNIGRRR